MKKNVNYKKIEDMFPKESNQKFKSEVKQMKSATIKTNSSKKRKADEV